MTSIGQTTFRATGLAGARHALATTLRATACEGQDASLNTLLGHPADCWPDNQVQYCEVSERTHYVMLDVTMYQDDECLLLAPVLSAAHPDLTIHCRVQDEQDYPNFQSFTYQAGVMTNTAEFCRRSNGGDSSYAEPDHTLYPWSPAREAAAAVWLRQGRLAKDTAHVLDLGDGWRGSGLAHGESFLLWHPPTPGGMDGTAITFAEAVCRFPQHWQSGDPAFHTTLPEAFCLLTGVRGWGGYETDTRVSVQEIVAFAPNLVGVLTARVRASLVARQVWQRQWLGDISDESDEETIPF